MNKVLFLFDQMINTVLEFLVSFFLPVIRQVARKLLSQLQTKVNKTQPCILIKNLYA